MFNLFEQHTSSIPKFSTESNLLLSFLFFPSLLAPAFRGIFAAPPGVIRFGKQSLDFLSIRVCATDGNGDFEMVSGCTRPIVFHQVPNYLLQADIVCSDRLHLLGKSPQLRRRLWVVACCVVCEYRPDLLFGEETGKRLLAIYGILLGRILGGGGWGCGDGEKPRRKGELGWEPESGEVGGF